jgi:hypothetical protein
VIYPGYFDRDAKPVTFEQWAALRGEGSDGYKRVAETRTGESWVSTVWVGIDMGYGDDRPPIIFETMVFGGPLDQEMDRYATEAEALIGHEAMVGRVRVEADCAEPS